MARRAPRGPFRDNNEAPPMRRLEIRIGLMNMSEVFFNEVAEYVIYNKSEVNTLYEIGCEKCKSRMN